MRLLSRFLPLVEAALATSALLDRYDSYAEVIAAPFEELRQVAGLGEHGASILRCVYEAAIHLATAPLRLATGVSDWASLSAYLNTSMARERNEVFRVLFLNSKNHLIADEVLAQGTTNAVHVSVRDIAQRSLQHGATSLLLLHNHPSGDPAPSPDDWEMTRIIESALTLLGIHLHDHVIVGKERFFSLKSMRLIHASPMKAAAA